MILAPIAKKCPILPLHPPYVDQPEIGFVHQGCGLNRVVGPLMVEMLPRNPVQFGRLLRAQEALKRHEDRYREQQTRSLSKRAQKLGLDLVFPKIS